jgi:streptogramin lyase
MPDERIFFTSYGTPTVYQFSPADAGADSGGLKMWQDPGGFYSLRGVRSDGNLLVWAAEDTGPDAGEIHGITLSGVGPPLTATFVDPEGLDLDDGGRVYVSDQGAGTVSRFSYATPSDITTLWESAGSAPKNLCTAGGFVYWISNEGLLQIDATVP